jgi:hypothetical protein
MGGVRGWRLTSRQWRLRLSQPAHEGEASVAAVALLSVTQ